MSAVVHIGPGKTATTSIQSALLPRLGRPFQVKPAWSTALSKTPDFPRPDPLPADIIVSDEALGNFGGSPPDAVAERLAWMFPKGTTVIYCSREPVARFLSLYRQVQINHLGVMRDALRAGQLKVYEPMSADATFDIIKRKYETSGTGFLATINEEKLRQTFEPNFHFVTVDFALLAQDEKAFVRSFCDACGCHTEIELPKDNASSEITIGAALDALTEIAPVVSKIKSQ